MSDTFVVGESYPWYCYHLRRIGRHPVKLGGHAHPRPTALCGREIAWDTRTPVDWFIYGLATQHEPRCEACREMARKGLTP